MKIFFRFHETLFHWVHRQVWLSLFASRVRLFVSLDRNHQFHSHRGRGSPKIIHITANFKRFFLKKRFFYVHIWLDSLFQLFDHKGFPKSHLAVGGRWIARIIWIYENRFTTNRFQLHWQIEKYQNEVELSIKDATLELRVKLDGEPFIMLHSFISVQYHSKQIPFKILYLRGC